MLTTKKKSIYKKHLQGKDVKDQIVEMAVKVAEAMQKRYNQNFKINEDIENEKD